MYAVKYYTFLENYVLPNVPLRFPVDWQCWQVTYKHFRPSLLHSVMMSQDLVLQMRIFPEKRSLENASSYP